MGIKSIVYFEIVSTIAIFYRTRRDQYQQRGRRDSNARRGGGGRERAEVAPHSASDLILNAFPENIAKSVAEGQVLQVVVFSILFGHGPGARAGSEAAAAGGVRRKPL